MIKSNLKSKDELKSFYENLMKDKLEGYIQMSDRRIKDIFITPSILPTWEKLHNDNFIFDASFYNKEKNISTLIRQIDNKWLVNSVDFNELDKKIEITQDLFISKIENNLKVKISHIWQEENDELCEEFPVLKHIYSAFVGFENKESKKGDKND